MHAMTIPDYGPADVLKLQDQPKPTPGDDDLLLEVHASALNPVDYKIRSGKFRAPRDLPIIPGFDVSGVVTGMGDNVQGFKEGDAVYAMPSVFRNGAHAEYVTVDHRTAARKPTNLDHATAALLPLVTITAWEAVHTRCRLHHGETILIQGGAGGVGHIAIQLAKTHGCRVLATAGHDESIALCEQLGAEVINYQQETVPEAVKARTDGRGCDVVLDCVGGDVFAQSLPCVAPEGRLATIVGVPPETDLSPLFLLHGSLHTVFVGAADMYQTGLSRHGSILQTAAELADADKLKPHLFKTYPLADLAEAHTQQETQRTVGKIGIAVR
jgi:NADPH2:quinone reductase